MARFGLSSVRTFLSYREGSILLVTVILTVIFALTSSAFASSGSLSVILTIASQIGIVAAGQTMLLVVGEIDLSVGAVFALGPYLMYSAYLLGIPLVLAFPIALLLISLVGLANGFVSVKLRVPSLITTLGMFFLVRGITLIISNFHLIFLPTEEPFRTIVGAGVILGAVPIPMLWTLVVTFLTAVMLSWTKHGLWSIATGSNLVGAAEVGVNTVSTKIKNFVLASVLAGLAGIIQAMRIGSAEPLQGGLSRTLESVAASVVGGTSLAGGSGTIVGALIGSILFGVLKDGLIIVGTSQAVYTLVLGLAVVLSVGLNLNIVKWLKR